MKQEKIKELASKIWELERQCQKGKNISENMKKIDGIADKLSISDLLKLDNYIENNFTN